MSENTPQIIGLQKPILAADFDLVVHFHVLSFYNVNLLDGTCAASYGGYASREAYEAGKRSLIHTTAQIKATPNGAVADLPTWFATQLLSSTSVHDLSGATPVYAYLDGTPEQAVGTGDKESAA